VIVNASRRRKRRNEARGKRKEVFEMLASNASVRAISTATGVPRSTIQDLKRKLTTNISGFLGSQGIEMPEDVEK
jgi:DNA invertase Pin-like site-specific DNA recombinase